MWKCEEQRPYLWWNSWSSSVGSQAWWYICDVGLSGAWRLVCLGRGWLRSSGAYATYLRYSWMVLFLICTLSHLGEARLWWSIGKVGTFGLGRHILHLCRAANGLLAEMVPNGRLMLGARLGRPHLDIEGGLTWGRGCSVRGWDRLRCSVALRLGNRAGRRRGDRRDSPRSLRFGRRLLGGSQRWLGWNDHTLVTSHWSVGGGGCQGSRVLKNSRKVCLQLKQTTK